MYNYLCGGADHFSADRRAVEHLLAAVPDAQARARANRGFVLRAVTFMATAGIRQFIDIGAGIPAGLNVHQTARAVVPDARVIYVDADPIACTHWQALLAGDDGAAAILADARNPQAILAHPEVNRLISFAAPAGVLFGAVLHFLGDSAEETVAAFRRRMCPGSMLALSHLTADGTPSHVISAVQDACKAAAVQVMFRTGREIGGLFGDFDLVAPGLVEVTQWPSPQPGGASSVLPIAGGVARARPR